MAASSRLEKLHDVLQLADVLHTRPSELVDRPVPRGDDLARRVRTH